MSNLIIVNTNSTKSASVSSRNRKYIECLVNNVYERINIWEKQTQDRVVNLDVESQLQQIDGVDRQLCCSICEDIEDIICDSEEDVIKQLALTAIDSLNAVGYRHNLDWVLEG